MVGFLEGAARLAVSLFVQLHRAKTSGFSVGLRFVVAESESWQIETRAWRT
jgi:hypothetical protein